MTLETVHVAHHLYLRLREIPVPIRHLPFPRRMGWGTVIKRKPT
jgi:hypothetical protein